MSRTSLDFLWSSTSPWIYVGPGEADRAGWNPTHFYSFDGLDVCTRRLRGEKMRCTADLMNEAAAALQFFDNFGENWYALEECLCYLDEWMPAEAYVIVIERSEELLVGDDVALRALLATLHAAGEFWSRPVEGSDRFVRGAVPFHILLNVGPQHLVPLNASLPQLYTAESIAI